MYDIDDILMDRYQIFGYRIGGMGILYFLTDLITGKAIAAKTYKPGYKDKLINRFSNELDFSLQFGEHENLLTVHFIENIDNQLYLFTDYVDGGEKGSSLMERINNEEMDFKAAICFAYQIANGMQFLNSRGPVAHLDLKPSNILVTKDDRVKITDFGLSRNVSPFHYHPTSENMGSWPYMSPEQFKGEAVDTRSDIYSFGIIFYEMLRGRYPFSFDPRSKSKKDIYRVFKTFHTSHDLGSEFYWGGVPHTSHQNALINKIGDKANPLLFHSGDLGKIIAGCIHRDPDERFPKFAVIKEAIEFAFSEYLTKTSCDNKGNERNDFQRGLDLQKLGQHSKALRNFNKALKHQSDDAQIWFAAAISLWDLKMQSDAIRFAMKAISMEPNNLKMKKTLSIFEKQFARGR